MTTGFGRNAPASQRAGLVLVPDGVTEFAAAVVDLAPLSDLKERIRTVLLSRIDPTVAGRIPRAALRREIAKLVNEIATEDRVQLNKLEEMALAADLSDDMVGLGPLEPFLDDEDITDILANGPFDIYVEGMASWKRPRPAFAMRSISSASRSGSPPRLAGASTKRARWSTPASLTAAGSTSSCRRWC
jgi:pilus assembly protein CpaF